MDESVRREVEARQISRICHLTPFRNLVHITRGEGLLSTALLNDSERREFNQQDVQRLDSHPDHICCSIEFPNAWYLRQRRRNATGDALLFPDWVCLCIAPHYLWRDDALFCPRNASAEFGRLVEAGLPAFQRLYAQRVAGAYGQTFVRSPAREASIPTDEQAEALIARSIALTDLQRIIVADEAQAKRAYVALEQIGASPERFTYAICGTVFDPQALSPLLRRGERPEEIAWDAGSMTRV